MKKLIFIFLFAPLFCFSQYENWVAVYTGTTENKAIYVGDKLVWEKESCAGVIIQGYCYDTVRIGTQTWLAANLYYDDGDGGIYSYDLEPDTAAIYGYLYTWNAAMRVDSLIDGWHLPTFEEWNTIITYLGGTSVAGGKLKEIGFDHWTIHNINSTNSSGFTALGAGTYNSNTLKSGGIRNQAMFWSSTVSSWSPVNHYSLQLYTGSNDLIFQWQRDYGGFSVRLIKDSE